MSIHTLTFRQSAALPFRLDDFLLQNLPTELERILPGTAFSKSKLRRLVVAGAVSVNGIKVRSAAIELKRGASVVVVLDTAKFAFEKTPDDIAFELTAERVLYEDEDIIVVDKPAGFPTEATMVASRDHLHAAVKRYLGGGAYVGLHHRLDRETSGVILFTKRREANTNVHKMFLEHLAKKQYQALTVRPVRLPKAAFSVDNSIGRISPKSAAGKWGAVALGGDPAHTDFRLLEERRNGLLVLAMPLTGRTHQIRVHLAGLAIPLLGDVLYGGPATIAGPAVPRVMLHASSLSFPHPADGRPMTVEAPLPNDFKDCLKRL